MAELVWETVGGNVYENGVDRGVLYLNDGTGVPWNGLTEVTEKFDKQTSPVYFDGVKVSDSISPGDYSAILNAITYPDEFLEFEGMSEISAGVFVTDQKSKTFSLSYRTSIMGVDGVVGYRTHVLYNATAIPSDKVYSTITNDPTYTPFTWEITAVPETIAGYRPTAHFVFDSRLMDPDFYSDLYLILYGGPSRTASLIGLPELLTLASGYYQVQIIDNNDGTWAATAPNGGYITMLSATEFEIDATATYLDADTYIITSTQT
jgi:hypothetical protein